MENVPRTRSNTFVQTTVEPPFRPRRSRSSSTPHQPASAGYFLARYSRLFRFITAWEKVCLVLGLSAAFLEGYFTSVINNVVGEFAEVLISIDTENCVRKPAGDSFIKDCTMTKDALFVKISPPTRTMAYYGLGQLIAGFFYTCCFKYVSEKQVFRIKAQYFEKLIRQEPGWHDTHHSSKAISRLVQNGAKIQRAMNENLGMCVCQLVTAVVSFISAFAYGPELTFFSLFFFFLVGYATWWSGKLETHYSEEQDSSYGEAGAAALEALENIKTVAAYGGEEKEQGRYERGLSAAMSSGIDRGFTMSISDAVTCLLFYAASAFTLWKGTCTDTPGSNPDCDPGKVLLVYLNLIAASIELGEGMSYFERFNEGCTAAESLFVVIDRRSTIDPFSLAGETPVRMTGKIELRDVFFAYPSRPGLDVLHGISLTINPGETVAFVGHSGSGKSSIVQLIQRLYDVDRGSLTIDGKLLKDLNISWLRRQIGVVGQEPQLFYGSVYDNVRLAKPDASDEEIRNVCVLANAHDFISRLPNGYHTILGGRGDSVSGGQKQRIAIARALIKNPSLLLLDEATSALDRDSEHAVQSALDTASRVSGRTTIIIAHRLSTIVNANRIFFIKDGQVLESGTHPQLLAKKGPYFALWNSQNVAVTHNQVSRASQTDITAPEASLSTQNLFPSLQSLSAVEREEDSADKIPDAYTSLGIWRQNLPEWHWLLAGAIGAMVQGLTQIFQAFRLGNMIHQWGSPDLEITNDLATREFKYLISIAFLAGFFSFLKGYSFTVSNEKLTFRLRSKVFRNMLYMDAGWFEIKGNNVGALCTRLSEDASLVQGVTGTRLANWIQTMTCIVLSNIIIMYFYSVWLGALAILLATILFLVAYYEEVYAPDNAEEDVRNVEQGSMIVREGIGSIKTIASLNIEASFIRRYSNSIKRTLAANLRSLWLRGLVVGLSHAFVSFGFICMVLSGAILMLDGADLSAGDIVAIAHVVTFGTQIVAEAIASSPSYSKAFVAGSRILKLLEIKPAIRRGHGQRVDIGAINGKLEFYQVTFAYPSRPEEIILNQLTFQTAAGRHIALVGPSGCGKSTTVKLVQRMYDPNFGWIKVDDYKITELDVDCYRKSIGIVSQEPVLFDRTIAENIAYGDNSREVPMEDIMRAAEQAAIHHDILRLEQQYGTRVGQLGGLLSGGQKQRIAIARALVRNPKILILDEATSALDAETESSIQHTLDEVSQNKTTITISHRAAAIRNSDEILILNRDGRLAMSGSHQHLIDTSEFYRNLMTPTGS